MSSTTPTLRHQNCAIKYDSNSIAKLAVTAIFRGAQLTDQAWRTTLILLIEESESGLGGSTITKKIPRLLCDPHGSHAIIQ
jgi:hypothetical protein